MFKLFNKKNKEAKLETLLPLAEDTLKEVPKSWPTLDFREILDEIIRETLKGKRYACFLRSKISKRAIRELRQRKYKIYISLPNDDAPFFKVWW